MSILETLANELGVDSRSLADNLTAGPNESLNATYLTIDPATGLVTALIVGSVQLPEGAQGSPGSSLRWVDANGILREYITGNSANLAGAIVHNILAVANPDTNDIAELLIRATEGGANTAEIAVFCKDSATNTQQSALVLDSLGSSNFLKGVSLASQNAAAQNIGAGQIGTLTVHVKNPSGAKVAIVAGCTAFASAIGLLGLYVQSNIDVNWQNYRMGGRFFNTTNAHGQVGPVGIIPSYTFPRGDTAIQIIAKADSGAHTFDGNDWFFCLAVEI